MRPHIKEFVRICAGCLDLRAPVVEIGARLPAGQEKMADLRSLFADRKYTGCDMMEGPGVDRIERLEALGFAVDEVGTFLLCDTLEHVRDIDAAIAELARCLRKSDGLVIATSVMAFPIHGHPSDYWRFTPEAFAHLFSVFEKALIFYAGDPHFPHTICVVAGSAMALNANEAALIDALARQTVFAPRHTDGVSAAIIAELAQMLLRDRYTDNSAISPFGFTGPLTADGWVLSPGSWIEADVPRHQDAQSYELRCDGRLLMSVAIADINPRAHTRDRACFQLAEITGEDRILMGRLQLHAIDREGQVALVGESATGVLILRAPVQPGFQRYFSPDRQPCPATSTQRSHGMALVDTLVSRGEKVVVDLGCGLRKIGNIGIDSKLEGTNADIACFLGFDPIPLNANSVDEVVCRDFLEHLPKAVFLESQRCFHYPILFLMDEVWRVLRPGGTFRSWTPMYPHPELFQDPTHLSAWTLDSMGYFCGDYPIAATIYGIKARFAKVEVRQEGFYLYAVLRKPERTDD